LLNVFGDFCVLDVLVNCAVDWLARILLLIFDIMYMFEYTAADFSFWATICKTVRPMLSDHCPICLSSIMLVYCGQTAGWMKMALDVEVDLGPGHIVLDRDPAPPFSGGPQSWGRK